MVTGVNERSKGARGGRQPFIGRGGITERGGLGGGNLAERAKMLFGLAFGSGYNETFQSCWGPEASRGGYRRRRGTPDLRER
jgi:hypothetical protein